MTDHRNLSHVVSGDFDRTSSAIAFLQRPPTTNHADFLPTRYGTGLHREIVTPAFASAALRKPRGNAFLLVSRIFGGTPEGLRSPFGNRRDSSTPKREAANKLSRPEFPAEFPSRASLLPPASRPGPAPPHTGPDRLNFTSWLLWWAVSNRSTSYPVKKGRGIGDRRLRNLSSNVL
jgi:hypothetical protein